MLKTIAELFEFYKIETDNTQNNFIIYDKKNKKLNTHISMITVSDIIKDRYLKEFFLMDNNLDPTQKEESEKLLKENPNSPSIKKYLISGETQKHYFRFLKDIILINKINVNGVTYSPVKERVIQIGNNKYINTNSFEYIYNTKKQKSYSFPLIEIVLKNILGEGYNKFLEHLSFKKQNPTVQLPCHWVIQDKGGTGKTAILTDLILSKLFPVNVASHQDLTDDFTGYLSDCEWVVFEEVEGFKDEKKLKNLTGAKTIRVNEKYEKHYSVKNVTSFIINSNELKSIRISDDDRRFNIVGGGKRLVPLNDNEWSTTLFRSEKKRDKFTIAFKDNLEKELNELNAYICNAPYNEKTLIIPLRTQMKEDLVKVNFSSEAQFINEIDEESLKVVIEEYSEKGFKNFYDNNLKIEDNKVYITSKGIYTLYKYYCIDNGLKQFISKNHFFRRIAELKEYNKIFGDYKRVRLNNKQQRSILVKQEVEEESEKELVVKETKL